MKTINLPNEGTLRVLRVLVLIVLGMIIYVEPTFAQGQTAAKLTTVKNTVVNIVNVIFVIGMVYGLIKTVMAFIGQKEGGLTNLMWLIAAAVVWVAFNYFMQDIGITSATGIGGK